MWGLDTHSFPSSLRLSLPAPTVAFFPPAFLAGFWGMGQTPARCLEMNELQGTHDFGGVSSEKPPVPRLLSLCWPGPEPCPVAHTTLLSTLRTSPCFSAPASPGCSCCRVTRGRVLCPWCQPARLAFPACSGFLGSLDLDIQDFPFRSTTVPPQGWAGGGVWRKCRPNFPLT